MEINYQYPPVRHHKLRTVTRHHDFTRSCSTTKTKPLHALPTENAQDQHYSSHFRKYEGWNFNSGNYLFTTDTK